VGADWPKIDAQRAGVVQIGRGGICRSVPGGGEVTNLSDGQRRARKPHTCDLCLKPIGVGWIYHHQTNLDEDAGVYQFKMHLACRAMTASWTRDDIEEFDAADYLENGFRWPTYDDSGNVVDMPDASNGWQCRACGLRGTRSDVCYGLCKGCYKEEYGVER
jgi:hypothetical protein